MKKIILLFISLLLTSSAVAQKFYLEPERIIGNDEDDDYTFYKIADIKFCNNNSIIVADTSRMSIGKYNHRGRFIKRVGSPGKGPQEYVSINSICVGNNLIFVNDAMQNIINIYREDLSYLRRIKTEGKPQSILEVMNDGSLMTLNYFAGDINHGRFIKLNTNGEIEYSFFDKCWWGKFDPEKKRDRFVRDMGLAFVNGTCRNGKIIFGFLESDNPTDIFVYSTKGKQLLKIQYPFKEKRYRLDYSALTFQGMRKLAERLKNRELMYGVELSSAFIYRDYYLVFIKYLEKYVGPDDINYNMFLVFNKKGKLIHEEDLCNELTFFDINEQGYMAAADLDAETVTVQIHKLVITD